MGDSRVYTFGPFRLDGGAERLWRGAESVPLTAKAFAVLRHLVDHAGRLVTKGQLIEAVWAAPYVSEAAVKSCIRDVRRALGDQGQQPQYVETVRGRGYRFIAQTSNLTAQMPALAAPGGPQELPRSPPWVVAYLAQRFGESP